MPPTIAAISPAIIGALEAIAIPIDNGTATRKTTIDAGRSYLATVFRRSRRLLGGSTEASASATTAEADAGMAWDPLCQFAHSLSQEAEASRLFRTLPRIFRIAVRRWSHRVFDHSTNHRSRQNRAPGVTDSLAPGLVEIEVAAPRS